MNDFLGLELKKGDYVVTSGGSKSSKKMEHGRITGFGKKMVTIVKKVGTWEECFHRYPGAVMKVSEEDAMMIKMLHE